jgi:hypothetical protein
MSDINHSRKWFKVQGSKFKVRFKVQGSRFGSRFKVQGSRFGSRFKVQGSRFKVRGSRFKVRGSAQSPTRFPRDLPPQNPEPGTLNRTLNPWTLNPEPYTRSI